jgi:hypothetical protein
MNGYRVYISGTHKDLQQYRAAVRDIVLKMNMFPLLSEDFSPSGADYENTLRKHITEADVFVGIYAHRYGATIPGSNEAYSEAEYRWARERRLPCLIFLVDDTMPWNPQWVEHGDGYQRLSSFKARLSNEAVTKYFHSVEDLQIKVMLALHEVVTQKREREGRIQMKPVFGPPPSGAQFEADAFMIMPFLPQFEPVYRDYIKPTVEDMRLSIKRGDDYFSKHAIITEIWGAIYYARFVVVECTGRNANVSYELGIAHTLGKPAIMITQNLDDIPFDLRHLRFILYQNDKESLDALRGQLRMAISRLL